jgi:hypothetical protein
LKQAIKPEGIMVVRLFGDELKWKNMTNMTLLFESDIKALMVGFDKIFYREDRKLKNNLLHHAFNFVLKKTV